MTPEQFAVYRRITAWLHSAIYHGNGAVMVPTADLQVLTDMVHVPASATVEPCDHQTSYQASRADHRVAYELPHGRKPTRGNF